MSHHQTALMTGMMMMMMMRMMMMMSMIMVVVMMMVDAAPISVIDGAGVPALLPTEGRNLVPEL